MGITGYNKYLQREFNGAFLRGGRHKRQPKRYDHVYVDVNNLLHVAAHNTNSERSFFKKLFTLLDNRLTKTNPRHSVTLALDGPAPMAKTITQRRRRIRLSAGAATPLSDDMSKLLKIGITPGSVLALKIDRALEYYVARRMLRRDHAGSPADNVLYEISSMRVAGEGEIKLVKSIQQRLQNPRFQGHSHCIVTEDSDALLLAMTLFGQGQKTRYASNEEFQVYVLSGNVVFSARLFDQLLLQSLPKGASLDSARRDFIGLSAMMGNDYITGSKLGAKTSWKAYLEMRGTYLYRDDPLFPMPANQELSAQAKPDGAGYKKKQKSATGIQTSVNWAFLKQLSLKLADTSYAAKSASNALASSSNPAQNDVKKKRVYDYLYGIEWMLNMYYQGECTDFSFYTYTQGPDMMDFASIGDEYDVSCDPLRDLKRAEASFYNLRPITPLAYSLAVIPRGGRAQISKNVRQLVDPGSPIRELFALDYCPQCINHRIHVSPMENALQNSLTAADPGFAEVVPSNAQFSKYSRYTDDEGYIIHPDTGEYMSMDEMRQEVKELNRMHLHHLHTAKQHVHTDPICLPTLEAAVARASADNLLTEDEEMLRTLASPVLFWRHAVYDPKDLDKRDFASEEELIEWRSKTIPDSQFEILDKRSVYELRKFDGDVGDVMRRWGCDNDAFARFDSEIAEGRTHSRQHTVGKTRSALDERLQKWRSERRGVGRVDDAKSTSDISIKTNDANGAASSLAPNRAPKPRPGGAGSKRRNFSKSPRAPSAFARVATAHSRVF
jgi:hypothetical protein